MTRCSARCLGGTKEKGVFHEMVDSDYRPGTHGDGSAPIFEISKVNAHNKL